MSLYRVSSTRFGSTIMKRSCSGELRKSRDTTSEWIVTDLPEPVVPAISACGIFAILAKCAFPVISLPRATSKGFGESV